MTYGIELRNGSGAIIADETARTLYLKAEGTCKSWSSVDSDLKAQASYRRLPSYIGFQEPTDDTVKYIVCGDAQSMTADDGTTVPYVDPLHTKEDLVFVQPASDGVEMLYQAYWDFPDLPVTGAYTAVRSPVALPYKIASPDLPGFTPTEGYGMQMWNAAGQSTFDSRLPRVVVFDVQVVSQAEIEGVIKNGDIIDLTLRDAQPDVWVAAPYFVPIRVTGVWDNNRFVDIRRRFCNIRQIGDSTIRLERAGGENASLVKQFFQDVFLIFAR